MARRKSTPTVETPAPPTLGVKKIRRIEDYSEPIKEPQQQATIIIPATPPPIEEEEDFYDSIEDTLDELDFEELIMMRVERLPNFRRDGKAGQRNTIKEFVGTIPFSASFREDIQTLFDGGDYRITLLDGQNRYASKEMLKGRKAIYKITIADKPKGQALHTPTGQVFATQAPEVAPQKTFIEQLKEFAEVNTQLAKIASPNGQNQALAPLNNTPPPVPIEEKVTALILDKILESKDESLTDKFISKYLGADTPPAFSWGEVLKEIVQPLVPVIVQLVPLIFQQRPPATAANATVEVTAQPEAAPPVAQMPEPTDTQKLLSITRNACLTNAPVTNTASAFDWLTTDTNREQLQAIFSQSPEKVLEVLHIEVLTERIGWMASLQRELQDEEEAEPEVIQ